MTDSSSQTKPTPEWSYTVEIDDTEFPCDVSFDADADECTALARRFQIKGVKTLSCTATINAIQGGDVYHVSGTVKGDIVQESAIDATEVDTVIEENFEGWFAEKQSVVSIAKARQDKDKKRGDKELKMVDEQDDPEPLIDGMIDIGELAAQYVSLAIDPYLSIGGSEYVAAEPEPHKPLQFKNPFADLQKWKDTFLNAEDA